MPDSETRRWGKAGVRLTDREAATVDMRNARRAREFQAANEAAEEGARDAWARGALRPCAITRALDACRLYGPEVDEACGVTEPAVDMWEAGQLYPSWDELKALATLTVRPVHYLTVDRGHMPFGATSMRFHLKAGQEPPPAPVLCFAPEAIQAATGTSRCPYCLVSALPMMPTFAFCPHCGSSQRGRTVVGRCSRSALTARDAGPSDRRARTDARHKQRERPGGRVRAVLRRRALTAQPRSPEPKDISGRRPGPNSRWRMNE
jgi:hypothetical protein